MQPFDKNPQGIWVVDSNLIKDPVVSVGLRTHPEIGIAIPSEMLLEASVGNAIENWARKFSHLKEFAHRILVVRNTAELIEHHAIPSGNVEFLADPYFTPRFGQICQLAMRAKNADPSATRAMLKIERSAREVQAGRTDHIDGIRQCAKLNVSQYRESDIQKIRAGKEPSSDFVVTFIHNVTENFVYSLDDVAAAVDNLFFDFRFRFFLFYEIYVIDHVSYGGTFDLSDRTVDHDMIDLGVAVTASYFDGLLSLDRKLFRYYTTARSILDSMQDEAMGPDANHVDRN